MNISAMLIPIFAISVGFIIAITAILTDSITKYKLKVEQIKADALVRAEEVRTRNQYELEKLMREEQNGYYTANASNKGNVDNGAPTDILDENKKASNRVRE